MTAHFKNEEFKCPHCGKARVNPNLPAALERLRSRIGKPIPILSGYRCPEHNAEVGGAPRSQHLYGRAADIPPRLATPSQAIASGFHGLGISRGWVVHVDVRDTRQLAVWHYD